MEEKHTCIVINDICKQHGKNGMESEQILLIFNSFLFVWTMNVQQTIKVVKINNNDNMATKEQWSDSVKIITKIRSNISKYISELGILFSASSIYLILVLKVE